MCSPQRPSHTDPNQHMETVSTNLEEFSQG
jgi:hypothetical protein